MDKEKEVDLKDLSISLSGLLLVLILTIIKPLLVMTVWNWFMPGLGIMEINYFLAFGLQLIVASLFNSPSKNNAIRDMYEETFGESAAVKRGLKDTIFSFVAYVVLLGIAFVVQLFV